MTGPVESIVHAVRTGLRSAREMVEEYLEISESLNPTLNAFTEIDRAGALKRADLIDAGPRTGPLTGVPIALKDLINHAGHVTTAGSGFYRHEATESATIVRRLERAGAIIMGRTGLHEFAYGFSSENPWFGPIRNPWDPDLSPGGSSGGSAAAVAAGMAPVSIGTDTGGSVRVPAALCGIVGLKVTHGRIPLTGLFPLAGSLDTVGPLARTTNDARLIYEAMKGFDPTDPWSVPVTEPAERTPPIEELRIAVPAAWLEKVATSGETRNHFDRFCNRLRQLGATVEEVRRPTLAPSELLVLLAAAEGAAVHRGWFADPTKPYGAEVSDRIAFAVEITTDQYLEAARWRASMMQVARCIFADYDLIVTPTVGHPRKRIGIDTMTVDGSRPFYREVLSGYTSLVNVLGCPAISLPLVEECIPPPAIQLIAPWWREDLLLDIGVALELAGLVGSIYPPISVPSPPRN